MKRWLCLVLGICMLFAMTGCASQGVTSDPDSPPAASDAGGQNPPTSATGEYNGQTITMSYKVTDVKYPLDMRSMEMQKGYAVFYDLSWYEEYEKTGVDPYPGDTWNILDRNGNVLLEEPYMQLTSFNKDGTAVAQKRDGSYVQLNAKLEETAITEQEYTAFCLDGDNNACSDTYPKGEFNYSCIYNDIALYIDREDKDSNAGLARVGLVDKDGNVIIPAFIPISYYRMVERVHLSEDIAFVEDFAGEDVVGNIGIITITRE